MKPTDTLEVWQRGPVEGVPGLLQPVAHALLQALEEIEREMENFPAALLWNKPAGVASVGFHLQHLTGVLDRLFTYARGEMLSPEQLKALTAEGQVHESAGTELLVKAFREQVQKALDQIRNTPEDTLLQPRGVGRKQIPSTVLGLLFHAAEHSQRHVGQLIVTARILRAAQVD
jgi:uncharacterized damage-inducible protein DinB